MSLNMRNVFLVSISSVQSMDRGTQDACMHVPASCIQVSWLTLIPYFIFTCCLQVRSGICQAYWENLLPGYRGTLEEQGIRREGCVHPPFKIPSMQISPLHHEEVMHDGYRPKMLLFALDELFYIFDQIRRQRSVDEKIVVAYEILCLSAQWCTERWHRVEKTGVPDALSLLNMDDAHHLKRLMWAVYDGALLVGR